VTDPWRVGDGWDYLSNQSHFHTVRVLQARVENGTRLYQIEETNGITGNKAQIRTRTWVNGDACARINQSYVGGQVFIAFAPPAADVRYFHNGTLSYVANTSAPGTTTRTFYQVNVRYRGLETLRFSWGNVQAGRVELFATRTENNETRFELTVRHVAREYLNDAQYQLPSGETFRLVAARAGDKQLDVLQPT
jgi:hypothetical protein